MSSACDAKATCAQPIIARIDAQETDGTTALTIKFSIVPSAKAVA
jgi:hypothetical protein